jgi:hypothetical protein
MVKNGTSRRAEGVQDEVELEAQRFAIGYGRAPSSPEGDG